MREIKFRAWNDKLKKFANDWKWQDEDGVLTPYSDDCILMQFTGLKDKNGKEIYSDDYLGDWCVFWGSGKYILQNISTGDIIDCTQTTTYDKEITGNRYENPREHTAMASDI